MATSFPKTEILDRHILRVAATESSAVVAEFCRQENQTALFCNVHMLMLARDDAELAKAMDEADYVFADGAPISWLQRRLSRSPADTHRGLEIMRRICEFSQSKDLSVGFFGSSDATLEALRLAALEKYPDLNVAYIHSPPFQREEIASDEATLQAINKSGISFLFVGLGCPKQEKWIQSHRDRLNCSLLGVGAAFDWMAGTQPMPPEWMFKAGLGWLHRLVHNPVGLWLRYLIYNTKFLVSLPALLLRGR